MPLQSVSLRSTREVEGARHVVGNFLTTLDPAVNVQRPRSIMGMLRTLMQGARLVADEQGVSAALRYVVKVPRGPVALADWIEFISAHFRAVGARAPDIRELRKPQRNYGVRGRSVRARVNALEAHYRIAAAQFAAELHRATIDLVAVRIAHLNVRDTTFDFWLGSSLPYGQKQEGELTAWITNDTGLVLARMAFSFGMDEDGQPSILIGGLQGLPPETDKKRIVTATRKLSGLRPKDAVLVAVQSIARALGIERIRAVSNVTHVLAAEWFMSGSIISRDYDGFWKDRGGVEVPGVGFALPLPDYQARVDATATPRLLDKHRASLTLQILSRLAAPTT